MATLTGFDATNVEPNAGFDPIPAGTYPAVVIESEMKPTKKGDGKYLEVTIEVLEGECKGRRIWDRMTIEHPNEQTVQIAMGALSALCRAVGVVRPNDSSELHNIPLDVKVGLKKRSDTGEMTNTVKAYLKKGGATAPATGAAKGSNPPWKR
ncbi:MAG: DUF669 domain-containing protein [Phycisphaeraceae bacterium]|nr:MAG: DUF669 domain-containing protein [Phycisphaeraceae bacterium]